MDDKDTFQYEVYKSVAASLEKDKRIAALEAQNARLLVFVEALAGCSASGLTWGDLRERYQLATDNARALLAELEDGERDG